MKDNKENKSQNINIYDYDIIIKNYITKLNEYYKSNEETFENVNKLNNLNTAFYNTYGKLIYKKENNEIDERILSKIIEEIENKIDNKKDLLNYENIIYITHLIRERFIKLKLDDYANPFIMGAIYNAMTIYEYETKELTKNSIKM